MFANALKMMLLSVSAKEPVKTPAQKFFIEFRTIVLSEDPF
jgi:hypothetical protein